MSKLFRRDGVWYAWVPKPGGGTRKVSTGCTDKDAAKKRQAELEREAVDPGYAAANQATTHGGCEEYVASRVRRGRSAGTLHHYGVKLGHVVRLMPRRLGDIDAAACEHFIEKRLEEGAAQTTVKKEIRALGAMLRHARRSGLYTRDPEAVIPELEDTYEPRERFLAPMELVALVNALPPFRAAHVVFIVATGARWGESVRAQFGDVSELNIMVHLRGTKTKRARRTVPVPPVLRVALGWALGTMREVQRRRLTDGHERISPAMFDRWGNVNRDLEVACEHIGIAKVTPNDLRRTFATWLAISGLTPDLVGKALGHTTSRMAELVYGRIAPSDLERLIAERGPALALDYPNRAGLLMGGDVADSGRSETSAETPLIQETAEFIVPGPGIEPGTRGFSIPTVSQENLDKTADRDIDWAANGLTFRARARRWFMRGAA